MNILVTAGPTREAIDPVRFISNRSSGKMGYAIAEAGVRRGHNVRLISGPVGMAPHEHVKLFHVVSADDMLRAVRAQLAWCEVLIMAAAVADWRPRQVSALKLKKGEMAPRILLERTPDILMDVRDALGERYVVGFAAETHNVEAEARRKLAEKRLDLIVANDVSRGDSGFEVDTNRVSLYSADGTREDWPLLDKTEVADRLVAHIERARVDRR